MKYFGTNLTDHGHYIWDVDKEYLFNPKLNMEKYPFDLERLSDKATKRGDCFFYIIDGYSILAIEGSCKDNRPGSHSVFFTQETMTKEQLISKVKEFPVLNRIINQMPFEVKWL